MSRIETVLLVITFCSFMLSFILGWLFDAYKDLTSKRLKALFDYYMSAEESLKDLEARLSNLEKQSDEK
jgi:hypothetical protein